MPVQHTNLLEKDKMSINVNSKIATGKIIGITKTI
jgi:hypothetical protein